MKFPELTKERLEQLYVQEHKTTGQIAEIIGCSDWTVSCYLAKCGIKTRTAGPKYNDLTKQTFGMLFVEDKDTSKQSRRGAYWKCRCECGAMRIVCGAALVKGTIYHCGKHTPSNSNHGHWRGGKHVPATYLSSIQSSASTRGIDFNLTIDYVDRLFIKQKQKCAISGLHIGFANKDSNRILGTASLDRIDNNKGYIKGNVHWVHKDINKMKWAYELDYFIQMCKEVAKNN